MFYHVICNVFFKIPLKTFPICPGIPQKYVEGIDLSNVVEGFHIFCWKSANFGWHFHTLSEFNFAENFIKRLIKSSSVHHFGVIIPEFDAIAGRGRRGLSRRSASPCGGSPPSAPG